MPYRAPSIRSCGCILRSGETCQHQRARKAEVDKQRPSARQRGYDNKWRKARATYLRSHPKCVMVVNGRPCGQPSCIVDHIKPHRGDQALFWDKANWQALCTPCHSSVKQRMEHKTATEVTTQPFIKRPAIPVVIVCGPAGSGKSTYVREHAGPHDIVIDFDTIRARLSGSAVHEQDQSWTKATLIERNRILQSLADDRQHERAWFIVGAPTHEERELWKRKLHADVVLLDTPLEVCIQRINDDPTRVKHRLKMHGYARSWWQRYTPGERTTFSKGVGYRSGTRFYGRAYCNSGEFPS